MELILTFSQTVNEYGESNKCVISTDTGYSEEMLFNSYIFTSGTVVLDALRRAFKVVNELNRDVKGTISSVDVVIDAPFYGPFSEAFKQSINDKYLPSTIVNTITFAQG